MMGCGGVEGQHRWIPGLVTFTCCFSATSALLTDGMAAEPGVEFSARDPKVEDTWGRNRHLLYSTDAGKSPSATVVACQSA